jgi:hypothetical protein
MNRIIIEINTAVGPDGIAFVSISLEEPREFGSPALAFLCTADDEAIKPIDRKPPVDSGVRTAGQRLYNALAAHPGIRSHLEAALLKTDRYPVFVDITTPAGAEALPWEALCSPGGDYYGLDERWALARTVPTPVDVSSPHRLTPPLRIAAVLSCLGISAEGELHAIREAAATLGPNLVEIFVLTSEEHIYDALQVEIEAGKAPEIARLQMIPSKMADLQRQISSFAPHVLHLFCHGAADGTPRAELALKSDWDQVPRKSRMFAEARDFPKFASPTDDLPWLVVLNCCEGAGVDSQPGARSLALSLALDGVAPAIVGMRKAVVSDTANELTETLYTNLLADLKLRIDAANESAEPLDWPQLVVTARNQLARADDDGIGWDQAAATNNEWTLPVVYVQRNDFILQLVPAVPADEEALRAKRLEIDALQTLLATLPADQGDDLKASAQARIAHLSAELAATGTKSAQQTVALQQ